MANAHAPGTFCWIELATLDGEAARSFYTQLFGWEAEEAPMPGDQGGTYTMLRLDGRAVAGLHEISGAERSAGIPSHWASYVSSADVDADVARAEAAGGSVLVPAMDVPGVGRMAAIRNLDGAVLGLFQAGGHPGFAISGEPGTYCWSELYTKDPAAAGRFYADTLGWSVKSDEGEDMAYYEFATAEGRFVAGMMQLRPEWGPLPPHWAVYLRVADLDASLARVGELGGRKLMGPKNVAEIGRFATIADPTGATFLIIEMAPGFSG